MLWPGELLPDALVLLAWLLFLPALFLALYRAPWWHLRDRTDLPVWLGATVFVLALWQIRAGIAAGLDIHLLGTTLLTLMFGRHFAVLSILLVSTGTRLAGAGEWLTLPLTVLLAGVVPAWCTWHLWRHVEARLPHNLFIYLFITTFFGAAACTALVSLLNAGVALCTSAYDLDYVSEYYLPFALLMTFPEAFVTGTLVTLLVALKPQWVMTYHDSRYLKS